MYVIQVKGFSRPYLVSKILFWSLITIAAMLLLIGLALFYSQAVLFGVLIY